MTREYEVTYITKEYLTNLGWKIAAYNPPGSQGTFTIPNPEKKPNFRGQTGSVSPDIVAIKKVENIQLILVVECKPYYNYSDVKKLKILFKNNPRKKLFIKILQKQCIANKISFDLKQKYKIILAKAHFGEEHNFRDLVTFVIKQKNEDWNPEIFNAREDIIGYFDVIEINPFEK